MKKGVTNEWERFNKTSLPEREYFYSNLNLKDITDSDYTHAKGVCKDFEINIFGVYHNLYFKCDTLILAEVFENFMRMYSKIFQLDPAKFFFRLRV